MGGKEDPWLFHPTHLAAEQWVRTAKAAGVKQIILIGKRHDGFYLWSARVHAGIKVLLSGWNGPKTIKLTTAGQ